MSLSRRLDDRTVRASLKPLIRNPRLPKQEIRVPRVANSASRVGTAFDYLLRFGLTNRYNASQRRTVAEAAAGLESEGKSPDEITRQIDECAESLSALSEGTAAQEIDEKTAHASLVIAAYDIFYRSSMPAALESRPSAEEISELINLFAIVPWRDFEPSQRLLLNPMFGAGSVEIGGADADIVLDDVLVEIKTIAQPVVSLEAARQAVCYALLGNRFGLNRDHTPAGLQRVGFYLSRCGRLLTAPLSECIDPGHHEVVLRHLLP